MISVRTRAIRTKHLNQLRCNPIREAGVEGAARRLRPMMLRDAGRQAGPTGPQSDSPFL